jgi:hypothetical protein
VIYNAQRGDHRHQRGSDVGSTPSTVSRPDAPVSTFASFVVEDGQPGAQQV